MLSEKPARREPTSHLVWRPGPSPTGRPTSDAAVEKTRRRSSRAAAKAALRVAWQRVTVEHLAERSSMNPRRFARGLDMSEDVELPMRVLIDVDDKEFEDAIEQLRKTRATRAMGRSTP